MDSSKPDLINLLKDFDTHLTPGHTIEEFAGCIDRILSARPYIGIDFNDIATQLKNSSVVDYAFVTVPYAKIGPALAQMIGKSIPDRKLAKIILNFCIGDDFTMDYVAQINEAINTLQEEIDVIWGITHSDAGTHEAGITAILGFN